MLSAKQTLSGFVLLFLLVAMPSFGFGQTAGNCEQNAAANETAECPQKSKTPPRPIQDNSFLIEEAYNQEFGVVQHIQTFIRLWNTNEWAYAFTQEWPVDSHPRNQLSYTLTAVHSGESPGSGGGFGDVILHYRYQAIGSGESKVAFAPRLSVLLPTGDARLGHGIGGPGIQTQLPFSIVLSKKFVTHLNAGAAVVHDAQNDAGDKSTIFGYNAGQSIIWLAKPRFNVLLEAVYVRNEKVVGPAATQWDSSLLLNPGIRWSYNFKNGLQIVPGISAPIGVGPSSGTKGVLFYLSFEHPFRHLPKDPGK